MHDNIKLRVLVVTSTFPRWEGDTVPSFVFELCQQLNKSGFIIDVVAPHAYGAKKHEVLDNINVYRYQYFFKKLQNLSYSGGILANLKKTRINYFLIPFFLSAQFIYLYKRLNSEHYDLIHAHWLIPQGLICAIVNKLHFRKAVPVLCTAHGSDLISLKGLVTRKFIFWTINNIAKVSLVSKSMLPYLEEFNIDKNDIEICPMGVDFNSTFKEKPEIKREPKRLIYVGRLIEGKGVKYILEALKIIDASQSNITLDVVGDGPERNELEKLSSNYGLNDCVTFYGSLNRNMLPEFYSRATIALVPSIVQEGFGLVIVEAMACGCAVVVSDTASSREIIKHEENGLLCNPADSVDISNKINSLLSDSALIESITSNARASVVNRYDWSAIANKYRKIIESICVRE
jgi:glycosyltransferase involved in cell wall biosynthesis